MTKRIPFVAVFAAVILSAQMVAGDALAFYLWKLAIPWRLGPDYGRTPQYVLAQWWVYVIWLVPAAVAIAAGPQISRATRRCLLRFIGITAHWG